jgi:hypothetical protein
MNYDITTCPTNKITAAIAECDAIIAKESRRAADLRPAYMVKVLDHAISHRAKLVAEIARRSA